MCVFPGDEMEEEELELFHVVQEDLRLKSTVGWQNAVKTLNSALAHIDRSESQLFLDYAFPKIVSIMLDQQYVPPACLIACSREEVVLMSIDAVL